MALSKIAPSMKEQYLELQGVSICHSLTKVFNRSGANSVSLQGKRLTYRSKSDLAFCRLD